MAVTAKQALTEELQALRRKSGPLVTGKLVYAPMIVKGLGGDDPELALERLLHLADDYGDDLDIDAAIFVMGHGALGETVLDKHTEWAALHFADERTARRRADAGIEKLVGLIMGPEPWLQPTVTQRLIGTNDGISAEFRLELPRGVAMQRFTVHLNDVALELDLARLDERRPERIYESSLVEVLTPHDTAAELMLEWRGEKAPRYQASVGAGLPAEVKIRQVRWQIRTVLTRTTQRQDADAGV